MCIRDRHLLEGLSGKNIFTDVAKLKVIVNLPKVFAPCHLKGVFGISTGYSYTVVRLPDFPATYTRNCFVVNKQGLIEMCIRDRSERVKMVVAQAVRISLYLL